MPETVRTSQNTDAELSKLYHTAARRAATQNTREESLLNAQLGAADVSISAGDSDIGEKFHRLMADFSKVQDALVESWDEDPEEIYQRIGDEFSQRT